jgi:small subunit ribosomal protein S9
MPETKKPATHKPRAAAHPRVAVHPAPAPAHPALRYVEAVGRRKTAIARVRIVKGEGALTVNGKEAKQYFGLPRFCAVAMAPAERLGMAKDIDVSAKVVGGGIHAQAEAVRLGLARALVKRSPEWKKQLRAFGFLTRDSRMVERKKYGLKKARRSPQWAKR